MVRHHQHHYTTYGVVCAHVLAFAATNNNYDTVNTINTINTTTLPVHGLVCDHVLAFAHCCNQPTTTS